LQIGWPNRLSDRVVDVSTLEQRMDDVRAVLDAIGSKRAALFGYSEGGPMCALFAATYPERTSALIMVGSYARRLRAPDYPFGPTPEQHEAWLVEITRNWGGPVGLEDRTPTLANDLSFRQWWSHFLKASCTPANARCAAIPSAGFGPYCRTHCGPCFSEQRRVANRQGPGRRLGNFL